MAADPPVAARYLTFHVGRQLYALPTTKVCEVIRLSTVARVPQGPRALLGLANLRGVVVPVVGLRELLSQEDVPAGPEKVALVLDHATSTALVVDSVDALETIPADRIDTGAFQVDRTQAVARILDIDTLLKTAFARSEDEAPPARSDRVGARVVHATVMVPPEMLVTFEVAGQEFALPLALVEEILPVPPTIATVTRTDAVIVGFSSVRDTLIPLLSLRGLLGFAAQSAPSQHEKVVVVKVGGAPVGLIADAVRSVVAADLDAMEPVPPVLAARAGGESRISSVYRGDAGRRLISVLSPDHLFREDVMQRLATMQTRDDTAAAPTAVAAGEELIFLVFRLGDDEFGLPIAAVVEVAQVPAKITRIPKTPKFLDGVVNLRGDVLPVIDQRRRFDMPPVVRDAPSDRDARRLVVMKTERHRAGIIVDSVSEVLRTSSAAISPPPDLTATISRLVHGVVNLEQSQRLVLLLNPMELLTQTERGQLDGFQALSNKARG